MYGTIYVKGLAAIGSKKQQAMVKPISSSQLQWVFDHGDHHSEFYSYFTLDIVQSYWQLILKKQMKPYQILKTASNLND